MMRFVIFRIFLLTLAWHATPECRAAAVDFFLGQSDAVVVGTPTGSTTRTDGIVIHLAVTSWLAGGNLSPAGPIELLWSAPNAKERQAFGLPAILEAGIWFLKDLHNGFYSPVEVTSNNRGALLRDLYLKAGDPGACASAFAYSPADTPVDKIGMVLACAASLEVKSPGTSGDAMRYSCGLGSSDRVHAAASYLAQMQAPRQRAIGIACLLALKDPSGMTLLDEHLQELDGQDVTRFIAPAVLGWAEIDPAGINGLGDVATNPQASGTLLKFAVTALASIHTPDTLPWLDKLLNRRERDTQMMAIGGIVQFINGYPIRTQENFKDLSFMKPSPTPYSSDVTWKSYVPQANASDTDLQAAVSFWKSWLRTNRLVQ